MSDALPSTSPVPVSSPVPAARSTAALEHEVILASAGSGKTFQLTSRFLRLVALGVDPGTILASTFTRAAAGEIRDRVVQRAVAAARDERSRAALESELGLSDGSLDAAALLAALANAWHRLRIRTLDSLMAGIVTTHALELGVPAGVAVADEAVGRELSDLARSRLLQRMDPARAVALLKELTAGRSDANVGHAVGTVVNALHQLWRESPPEAWERVPTEIPLPQAEVDAAMAEVARAGAAATDVRLTTACSKLLSMAQAGVWEELLATTLAKNAISSAPTYQKRALAPTLIAALLALRRHATSMVLEGIRRQTLAARDLVAAYDEALAEVKRERGVVTFDDLPLLLTRAASLGTLEEIGYRLDARLHHLLLDEMQDTSAVQWQGLRPFAAEIYSQRAGERSFFAVGDLKQSIYGWRGASPEVFAALPRQIGVAAQTLERTRRCGPEVVAAVNALFGTIRESGVLGDKFALGAERFGRSFLPHETTATGPSFVELRSTPACGAEDDHVAARLAAAADVVAELHRTAPTATIGVLVRKNETVNRLLVELGAGGRGLPISGRGGAPLIDAPPVEAILDALRLSLHPRHTAAAFNVASSPLGAVVVAGGLSPDDTQSAAATGRVSASIRRRLLQAGLAETVRAWVAELAGAADERERRRLVQLAELAARVEAEPPVSVEAFVSLVESMKVADDAPAPIQAMTIHQSKGLEFDLVVLPELDGEFVRSGRDVAAFDRPADGSPPTCIVRWVDQARRAALPPELEAIFGEQTQRQAQESLCLLYVAMTRARRGLIAVVEGERPRRPKASWAALLREALAPDVAEESAGDPERVRVSGAPSSLVMASFGDREATLRRFGELPAPIAAAVRELAPRRVDRHVAEAREHASPAAATPLASSAGVDIDSARTLVPPPSSKAGASPVSALRVDFGAKRDAIDRGIAIHACFARIRWIEEFQEDDASLRSVVASAVLERDPAWCAARVGEFRAMLRRPSIAAALARPAEGAGIHEVQCERPFLRLTEAGVQRGTIDRLVLRRAIDGGAPGAVVAAEILDFKTGSAESGGGAAARDERAQGYTAQLQAYAAAVASDWRLEPTAIATTLLFVDDGEVVRTATEPRLQQSRERKRAGA